jgi:hypothetical protein
VLREHIVADGIDQWSEALCVSDAAGASQKLEAACEGLLLDVFQGLPGGEAGAQLQLNEFPEIRNEMVFRVPVARTESLDVRAVERLEVHAVLSIPW